MASEAHRDESFIGEAIQPRPGSFDARGMATGAPGLPGAFTWRGVEYEVAVVLKTWRTREPGVGRDKDWLYVRKQWFKVRSKSADIMSLYFDHKPLAGRGKHKQRWFLFSMAAAPPPRPARA
jgi:hypothetical protein